MVSWILFNVAMASERINLWNQLQQIYLRVCMHLYFCFVLPSAVMSSTAFLSIDNRSIVWGQTFEFLHQRFYYLFSFKFLIKLSQFNLWIYFKILLFKKTKQKKTLCKVYWHTDIWYFRMIYSPMPWYSLGSISKRETKKTKNWVFSFNLWLEAMCSCLWKIGCRSSMTKTVFSSPFIIFFHLLYKAGFTVGTMMTVGKERKT